MLYKNIYAIGDSHALTFYSITRAINFGPETMYQMGTSERHRLDEHINYRLDSGDLSRDGFWIFCFGEIDVRCHIHKQVTEKMRSEEEVIDNLVNNYIEKILTVHPNIGVMSVVPPAFIENKLDKVQHTINTKYNFVGSDTDRSRYTRKINEKLNSICKENNILYFDVYALYADDQGFLAEEHASLDQIHIRTTSNTIDLLNSMSILNQYR